MKEAFFPNKWSSTLSSVSWIGTASDVASMARTKKNSLHHHDENKEARRMLPLPTICLKCVLELLQDIVNASLLFRKHYHLLY